jgi:NTE family protein
MHMRARVLVVALLIAWLPGQAADPVPGAPGSPGARPRIGLVLGGGGAKGGAHIGVLKVLEELRVPVDCIAGTSMGAIVGAAYATGMSAGELAKIVGDVNWQDTLESAPREGYTVRRKALDFLFTNGFELGIRDGKLVFPGGLVPTQQIEALFRSIVSGARRTTTFDRLPIPFRAVATDLENGDMRVFDRGDLAVAMRASMAVPAAFAPVEVGGRLYVDGMLVRNLPVDVARNLCADVIIAVSLGNPVASREKLGSALAVAGQAMNIAIEANEKTQLATLTGRDVAIPVILKDITSSDFYKVPEAIPIGEAAARSVAASLARYSLPPAQYAAWRAEHRQVTSVAKVTIDEVRLVGLKVTNPEVVRTFITSKAGEVFNPAQAEADATNLVERGDYSSVSSQLLTEDGRNVLVFNATEKAWGPNYIKFDGNLATDFKGDLSWGLRVDYEKRWLNDLGGEFRVAGQVGRPSLFLAQFYQPVEKTQTFYVMPAVYGAQARQFAYDGNSEVALFNVRRYGARLEGGAALGSWGDLRLGVLRGKVNVHKETGEDSVQASGRNDAGAATARFYYDTLDKRLWATQGTLAYLSAYVSKTGLGADENYKVVEGRIGTVFSFGRNVFTVGARGGTDLGSHAPDYDQFKLGGLFQFSGYRAAQLVGREYAMGTVQYRRRIGDLNESFGTGIYAGASLEAGNVWKRADGRSANGLITAGSLFVGVDSKLGPIYLGYGRSGNNHSTVYLYIGSAVEAF